MQPPLLRLREFLGISQRELAHLLNISHGLLSKIETGTRNTPPSLDAPLAQWMLALDLAEAAMAQSPPAPLPPCYADAGKLREAIALYSAEANYLEVRVEKQRPLVAARQQQLHHWQALKTVAGGFPAIDQQGLALLAGRKEARYTAWSPLELAKQEERLRHLQALVAGLQRLQAAHGKTT